MDTSKSSTSSRSLNRLLKAGHLPSSHTPKPAHPVRKPRTSDLLANIIEVLGSRESKSSRTSSFTLTAQTNDKLAGLRQGLSEKLALLGAKCDPEVKFEAYQSTFKALLALDTPLNALLRMLEAGYNEYISRLADSSCRIQLNKLLLDYQATLDQDQTEKEALLAMISTLKEEKAALEANLATERNKSKALDKKLMQSLEISTMEDSQGSIIEGFKRREQTLLETLKTAKDRGFPVVDILKETMRARTSVQRIPAPRPSPEKAEREDTGRFEPGK